MRSFPCLCLTSLFLSHPFMQSIHPTHSLIFLVILRKDTIPTELWGTQKCQKIHFKKSSFEIQRSGSVMFRYGSRSADPYYWITDPDHALFFSGFQNANKIFVFSTQVFLLITHRSPYRYPPTCHLYR